MGVDTSLRAKIRAEIARDYGEHTILPANRMPPVRRLPSGSLALDYIMGGGCAFGVIHRLWGAYSTGKSTFIYNVFRQAQNFGDLRHRRLTYLSNLARISGDTRDAKKLAEQAKRERDQYADGLACLYVSTEGAFDYKLAERLGVRTDEDSLELIFTRRIEEIGDHVQKALLGYHVVAVDSTTGAMSIDELATDKGQSKTVFDESQTTAMNRARKWGYNLDWWQDRMSLDNVLIITSQIQSVIGMSARQRAAQEKAPGGEKLNHEPGIVLHFMKGGWLKRKDGGGLIEVGDSGGQKGAFGKAQAAGSEVVVRCEKNKTGRSHRTALLHHDKMTANFDQLFELEKFAKYFKVVDVGSSGWVTLPGGKKTQSLRSTLEESPDLVNQVIDITLRCAEDPQFEDELLRSRGGAGEMLAPVLEAVA